MTILQMWKDFFHRFWFELHNVRWGVTNNTTAIEYHDRIFYQMTIMYKDFKPAVHGKHIGRNH